MKLKKDFKNDYNNCKIIQNMNINENKKIKLFNEMRCILDLIWYILFIILYYKNNLFE